MSRSRTLLTTRGLDALVALLALAGSVGTLLRPAGQLQEGTLRQGLEAAAVGLMILILLLRRRAPFLAPAATWLVSAALSFVDGRLIVGQTALSIAGMLAAVLLGYLSDVRQARAGLAIVVVCAATIVYNDPTHVAGSQFFIPALFALGWLVGSVLHERSEVAQAAEQRAVQAERERATAARVAVAEERARIARELHDIVAHAVSVMVLQVGAVRHRMPGDDSDNRAALQNVEDAGRLALMEMRRLLDAMRRDDGDAALAPQPGLAEVNGLVDEVRAAGLDVVLDVQGEPAQLSPGLDLSAYRIVQEGLTNTLRHAEALHARITVRYTASRLELEVRDDGRGADTADGRRAWAGRDPGAGEDLRRGHDGRRRRRRRLRPVRAASTERTMPVTIRTLVADDQAMVRAGLRMLLTDEPGIDVVAEARDGFEAVAQAARHRPEVVLMDIRMPGLDGLEATRRILAAEETARVLILTTFDLDEYLYEALRAGASGFVLKDDPPEQLIAAVRTIAAGDALLSPSVTRKVIAQFTPRHQRQPPQAVENLTSRETDVLRLIAQGRSNAEIGRELFISDTTVKTHVTRVLQKLGVRDRAQAIVLAYQCDLFTP